MGFLLVVSSLLLSAVASPVYGTYQQYGVAYHGPPAPLAQDGRVVDTPEVAHARAAHLAAHAAEAAKSSYGGYADYSDDYSGVGYNDYGTGSHHAYHGPPAPLAHDGRVIDTPEVAQAKAAHLAAHAQQVSKVGHVGSYADPYAYSGHW